MSRRLSYGLALSFCLFLAFAVRLYRLDGQSLWYDEGVTAELAQRSLAGLTEWTAHDIQPPLYYYATALWGRAAGWSEWSLRWPSAAWGVLGVALCAAVALELTQRRTAALLAGWLAALHPLLLYYSQEARMYSMLTALGLAAALLLLRSLRPAATWRSWALFALAGAAAAYTHYFAFFLLAGLAVAALWDVRRSPPALRPRRARALAASYTAILVLYAPWLAILFSQLAFDSSYWQGRLKLAEALRSVLVSFTSGETVREPLAFWLLVPYALLTLLAAWAARRPFARRALVYSLCWLVAPVAAVLLLASFAPKFNPRYTTIALPGMLLLWSAGAAALLEPDGRQAQPNRAAASLLVGMLTAGFVFAGANWFVDPAFTKDQWRELAHDLRSRLAPEEKVVLVSGHAWPVWRYYAPDIDALRLPNIDVLDVNAVLDFTDTAAPLRAALDPLSDRPGVWLVLWQDEVVDPTGVVPVQLVIGGREKGMDTRFWGIGLRRFSGLKTNWFADEPPITVPLDIAYDDGKLLLRGATPIDNGDLLLFWERREGDGLLPDYELAAESFDAGGAPLLSFDHGRLAGYDYPSFRWPAGKVVMGRIPAAQWLGASPQPGSYSVQLGVRNAAAGGSLVPAAGGQDLVTVGPLEVVIE